EKYRRPESIKINLKGHRIVDMGEREFLSAFDGDPPCQIFEGNRLSDERIFCSRSEIIESKAENRGQHQSTQRGGQNRRANFLRPAIQFAPGDKGAGRDDGPEQVGSLMRRQAEDAEADDEPAKEKALEPALLIVLCRLFAKAPEAVKCGQTPGRGTAKVVQQGLIKQHSGIISVPGRNGMGEKFLAEHFGDERPAFLQISRNKPTASQYQKQHNSGPLSALDWMRTAGTLFPPGGEKSTASKQNAERAFS